MGSTKRREANVYSTQLINQRAGRNGLPSCSRKEPSMAGQVIDIRSKITNELPMIQITDELTVTVNNRKSVVLNIQAMVLENEKKEAKGKQTDEMEFMIKALGMLIGQKNVDTIEEMDLPLPEYKEVFQSIMSVATGTYGETPIK